MSKRKSIAARQGNAKHADDDSRSRRWLLAALAAMLVVQVLLPADANTPAGGAGVPLAMLWLVLTLAYSVLVLWRGQGGLRFGAADAAVLALVAICSLSGIWATHHGAARPAINVTWEWIAMGCCFFLVRQLIRRPSEGRAVAAAMIALAVGLSAVAIYEVAYELPQKRKAYEADRDGEIRKALGVEPNSEIDPLARRRFEARLYSPEPVASFILANSLAGYLAPWLIVAAGATMFWWRDAKASWRRKAIEAVGGLALTIPFLLTNSRTALVAVVVGGALLSLIRPGAKRFELKVQVVVFILLTIALNYFFLTGERLKGARRSFSYRVEYWQATAEMIWDRPLLGCGPGNFSDTYTAYKLPEALEEVADPHNFLLEVWATAGTLAAATLLAALVLFFRRSWAATSAESSDQAAGGEVQSGAATYILLGAGAAVPLAWALGMVFAPVFESRIEWPAAAIVAVTMLPVMALMRSWVRRGKLSSRLVAIGVIVLLVHLSGAGGIGNHGVAATLWILMALGLNMADGFNGARRVGKGAAVAVVAGVLILTVACQRTAYSPVVKSKSALAAGLAASWNPAAFQFEPITKFREAAAFDPLAAEPQRRIAMSAVAVDDFEAAAGRWIRNAPHRFSTYRDVGHIYLALFHSGDAERSFLKKAVDAYRQAVRCYPNSAILHADLAWALHLDGDVAAAKATAAEALRLDDANPHADQKLDSGNYRLADRDVPPKSIRQRMEELVRGAVAG